MSTPSRQHPGLQAGGDGEKIRHQPDSSRADHPSHQHQQQDLGHHQLGATNDNISDHHHDAIHRHPTHHAPSRQPLPSSLLEPNAHIMTQEHLLQHQQHHQHQDHPLKHHKNQVGQPISQQQQHSNQTIGDDKNDAVDVEASNLPPPGKKQRRRYDNNFKVCACSWASFLSMIDYISR